MSQDGHGGLWMQAWRGSSTSVRAYLYHYGGGAWTQQPVPAKTGTRALALALTWIPGTRSLWATGLLSGSGGALTGDILKYGP